MPLSPSLVPLLPHLELVYEELYSTDLAQGKFDSHVLKKTQTKKIPQMIKRFSSPNQEKNQVFQVGEFELSCLLEHSHPCVHTKH